VTIPNEGIEALNARFENACPREILAWAVKTFGAKLTFALGFGAEGMMILDLLMKIDPQQTFGIFTLDTLRLPEETYDLMARATTKYNLRLERFTPDPVAVDEMNRTHGEKLYLESRALADLCCKVRKVNQLAEALAGRDAWIASLRREQGGMRQSIPMFVFDEKHGGILKIHPLVSLTEKQVWDYIGEQDVPYNALHQRGYRSIGCQYPCTGPTPPSGNSRDGRFLQFSRREKTECGLHFSEPRKAS
jgi:phosphoadenosine phosphosulfate reductase